MKETTQSSPLENRTLCAHLLLGQALRVVQLLEGRDAIRLQDSGVRLRAAVRHLQALGVVERVIEDDGVGDPHVLSERKDR